MHTLEQLRAGTLNGATRLKLSEGLSEFPREIFDLADTLEILDLGGNALSTLPDDLHRLHRLQVLFASNNRFTHLPESLGQCAELSMVGLKSNRIATVSPEALPPKLRWLILTDNDVTHLPESIGQCADLQKLMLAGNRLRDLPTTLADCHRLELLRIAANDLSALPDWLTELPRLAWLAFAGNPFASEAPISNAAAIAWRDIDLQQVLGEGASGIIHRAALKSEPVAVKLFKGAVTSDGLPHGEMTACLHAGAHPNLIPVRGRVIDASEGREALVMDLIDPAYCVLAGPPSFESCTRDIYTVDTRFTAATARMIAKGIASAAAHLHSRGLLHGDLYAHNILHDGYGHALIGDFGAASYYGAARPDLQRLDVRAFGCLLEELVTHSDAADPVMASFRDACLNNVPAARPLFADMADAL
jgi:tRNA A-37 threonylcarbamoyl transferase component Bud32